MPEIIEAKGIIVNTLVSQHLREMMVRISRDNNIDAIDLMGPLLSRFLFTSRTLRPRNQDIFPS